MSDKTLKIKRVFAWSIYNNLRNVPPKDYPSTGEIKSTINEILPALKEHVVVYADLIKEAVELQVKITTKEVDEKTAQPEIDRINGEFRKYTQEHGSEVVEIRLADDGLKTLTDQFNRDNWGKNWITNIEEFGELLEALEQAKK